MGNFNKNSGLYEPSEITEIFTMFISAYNEQFNTDYSLNNLEGTDDFRAIYIFAQIFALLETDVGLLSSFFKKYINDKSISLAKPPLSSIAIIHSLKDSGYIAALNSNSKAGYSELAVYKENVDFKDPDQANTLANIYGSSLAEGIRTQGPRSGNYMLENGQIKKIHFREIEFQPVYFNVKVTYSVKNPNSSISDLDIKDKFIDNFNNLYEVGSSIYGSKFLELRSDLPYASSIVVEQSYDNEHFTRDILEDSFYINRCVQQNYINVSQVAI